MYIRVVHSWHFQSIFHSFFTHFRFHLDSIFLKNETENEMKNGQYSDHFSQNQTIPLLLQKVIRKMVIFHPSGTVPGK